MEAELTKLRTENEKLEASNSLQAVTIREQRDQIAQLTKERDAWKDTARFYGEGSEVVDEIYQDKLNAHDKDRG